ncbi:MAG TPA: Fic family protein [Ilumatobacter sp.]|nr:Fic family protein [Ilumatobacter sp.]
MHKLVFAGDAPAQTINSRVQRGELRRLTRGVYTPDLTTPASELIRREWLSVAGRAFPDAVISDRSAPRGGPVDGLLYLVGSRRRELELPGLTIIARDGAPPLDDDIALPGGLYMASRARALVENTFEARARSGRPPRTLDDDELADWVNHLCAADGEARLTQYRRRADEIAAMLGAKPATVARLSQLIGAALGSQHVDTASAALNARQYGRPFDTPAVHLFDLLVAALRSAAPQSRPAAEAGPEAFQVQAFFEAYFSNFIEGTTFEVDEARQIVFDGQPIATRPQDSHDIAGTFAVVADAPALAEPIGTADEFIDVLRSWHRTLLGGRPELEPGTFKRVANRAGNTQFVAPALVDGTLRAGFERLAALDTAWERAVYTMFLVAEVHPFNDGNGRIARVMMNAELVRGRQSKIIVPTGYRDGYLGALRRLTRDDDPTVLVRALRYLHDYTSQIDWTSFDSALGDLTSTNAFNDDEFGPRLRLLRSLNPADLT